LNQVLARIAVRV